MVYQHAMENIQQLHGYVLVLNLYLIDLLQLVPLKLVQVTRVKTMVFNYIIQIQHNLPPPITKYTHNQL